MRNICAALAAALLLALMAACSGTPTGTGTSAPTATSQAGSDASSAASVAEESNDEKGLILPVTVAPWQVHLCALRPDKEEVRAAADAIYEELQRAGIDVLYDDRDCAAGIKFADADLMGMPIRVVVSPRTLEQGEAEVKLRKGGDAFREKTAALTGRVKALIAELTEEIEGSL